MKTEQNKKRYWCHSCQTQFSSQTQPGQDEIVCISCKQPFCELLQNTTVKQYHPYQKQPTKKQKTTLRIGRATNPVHLFALHQILEEEQHQNEGIEISNQELRQYKKTLERDSECSVCREDLKAGQKHLIFECRHAFHEDCLVDWLKVKNSCPTCRRKMIPD